MTLLTKKCIDTRMWYIRHTKRQYHMSTCQRVCVPLKPLHTLYPILVHELFLPLSVFRDINYVHISMGRCISITREIYIYPYYHDKSSTGKTHPIILYDNMLFKVQ